MGDVKKAFGGAIREILNFPNIMTWFTEGRLIEKKENLPMNNVIESLMIEKLQETLEDGDMEEYHHLRNQISTTSITDFSITELLDELIKRTE